MALEARLKESRILSNDAGTVASADSEKATTEVIEEKI